MKQCTGLVLLEESQLVEKRLLEGLKQEAEELMCIFVSSALTAKRNQGDV